ncbi:MAG: ornithine cyclodeaminase family protein [Flammeovirgaceae bacterium]|nr:ornithine cyclodeaminase family protein [Flammeovirgaceae bacterium]
MIGAGTQSYFQVLGVLEVRPIKKIMLFGRSEKNLHELKNKLKTIFGGEIRLPERKTELQVADIICTATTSDHPVVERSHINDHVHINGIGSFKPSMNEISAEVIKASTLVVDHRESALSEAGDILKAIAQNAIEQHHIHAELGEILSGNKVGRESNDQITIFKSVGNAIQDLVMADYIVKSLV